MKRLFGIAFILVNVLTCQAQQDTISVYFATGKALLTPGIQHQLVDRMYNDVLQPTQSLEIVGYADFVGGTQYNDRLSTARAAAVKQFLLSYGFHDKNIIICIGKGEVTRDGITGKSGFARDRRVDIVIDPKLEPVPMAMPVVPPPIAQKATQKHAVVIPDISKLKPNETVVLDKIYFSAGRHIIRRESMETLQRLYEQLREHPEVKLSLEGHVCCLRNGVPDAMDDDTHEIALSVNRAKAIYTYLVQKGIDKDRLSYKGFGAAHRISEENTEEEADRNRRVELRIVQ